jgi:hypothetical protein
VSLKKKPWEMEGMGNIWTEMMVVKRRRKGRRICNYWHHTSSGIFVVITLVYRKEMLW